MSKTTDAGSDSFERFLEERRRASDAFVDGHIGPLDAISTRNSPATLFPPTGACLQGADRVNEANRRSAQAFRPGSRNNIEIMHRSADGSLAYWVGIQRSEVLMEGSTDPTGMALRVTEIFRYEEDGWRLVHRHADFLIEDEHVEGH